MKSSPDYLLDPNDITDHSGTIFIYGYGAKAQELAEKIRHNNQSIKGFVTSFENEKSDTEKVYFLKDIWEELNSPKVTLIIANQFAREIINMLEGRDLKAKLVNAIHYVLPSTATFQHEEENALLKQASDVAENLSSERSKILYLNLINLRKSSATQEGLNQTYHAFFNLMNQHYGTEDLYVSSHYTEYVEGSKFNNIIEGGFCLGNVALKLLPYLSEKGVIHSFEPGLSEIKRKFPAYLERQPITEAMSKGQLEIHESALWHEVANLYFSDADNPAERHIASSGIPVKATSLDAFCQEKKIENVDYIKLDIEGAELNFIDGATESLLKCRPVLAISIYHGTDQIITIPAKLMQLLPDYRFEVGHHSNSPWQETVLYAIPNEETDV